MENPQISMKSTVISHIWTENIVTKDYFPCFNFTIEKNIQGCISFSENFLKVSQNNSVNLIVYNLTEDTFVLNLASLTAEVTNKTYYNFQREALISNTC